MTGSFLLICNVWFEERRPSFACVIIQTATCFCEIYTFNVLCVFCVCVVWVVVRGALCVECVVCRVLWCIMCGVLCVCYVCVCVVLWSCVVCG